MTEVIVLGPLNARDVLFIPRCMPYNMPVSQSQLSGPYGQVFTSSITLHAQICNISDNIQSIWLGTGEI